MNKILKSILLVGLLLIGISNCSDEPNCCTIIDVNVDVLYQNLAGKNLINSNADFDELNIN